MVLFRLYYPDTVYVGHDEPFSCEVQHVSVRQNFTVLPWTVREYITVRPEQYMSVQQNFTLLPWTVQQNFTVLPEQYMSVQQNFTSFSWIVREWKTLVYYQNIYNKP